MMTRGSPTLYTGYLAFVEAMTKSEAKNARKLEWN